ncbi:MAG: molybdenum cofactor guanylyltransferase [Planctomycetota bacterium]|nr:molybdenum cofactor guanylyltransferase [Planctomycetota bacterium]
MAHGSYLWPHSGAILCGGRSTRMGEPKHDLKLPDGRTMIEVVRASLGDICQSLVVVGPKEILPELPHVNDLRENQGPLAGLEALLASGLDERYLVVPCDVPRVNASLLRMLVDAPPASIATFQVAGSDRRETMPLRISATCLKEVVMLLDQGRRAVHQLFDHVECVSVTITKKQAACLLNVNTPEDFNSIERPES